MPTYYIAANGNNSNNGTSVSTPKLSWAGLPTLVASDRVYFRCGDTFTPSAYLNVTWGGTSSNRAIIGAYYVDGGIAVHGVSGNRPIISGNDHVVPTRATYVGLVTVRGNYVTIKDLVVYQSGGHGISIEGNLDTPTSYTNFVVENCEAESSYFSGISINKNRSNNGTVQGCEVLESAWGWKYDGRSDYPGGLVVTNCPTSGTTIKQCYVHHNWGEGIGIYRPLTDTASSNSGHVLVEDNLVFCNQKVGIYSSRTESNVIRRNLIVGGSPTSWNYAAVYSDGKYWHQSGIEINTEVRAGTDWPSVSNNNLIYSNIVVGSYHKGIHYATGYDSGTNTGNKFYNNTVIGCHYSFDIGTRFSGYTLTGIEYKNNISICPADCISSDVLTNPSWFPNKITASHNSWESRPSYWAGTGDVVSDSNWERTTGFQNITDPALALSDLLPLENCSALNAGVVLPSPYNLGIAYTSSYSAGPPIAISVNTMDRTLVGWDLGAIISPITDYSYYGWSTQPGVPTRTPTSQVPVFASRTYLRKVTLQGSGLVYSVRFRVAGTWSPAVAWVAVYRLSGGTYQRIGYATVPAQSINTWTAEIVLTTPDISARSAAAGEDLYAGVVFRPTSGGSVSIGREETGGDGLYYAISYVDSAPLESIPETSMSLAADRDVAFVLGVVDQDPIVEPTPTQVLISGGGAVGVATHKETSAFSVTSVGGLVTAAVRPEKRTTVTISAGGAVTVSAEPWVLGPVTNVIPLMGSLALTVTAQGATSMTVPDQNFTLHQGESKKLSITLGENITGSTVIFKVALSPDGPAFITRDNASGVTIPNAATGEISIPIYAADSAALLGTYYFEVELLTAGNDTAVVTTGTLTSKPSM